MALYDEYRKTGDLYDLAWEAILAQVTHIVARSRMKPRTAFWLRKLKQHAEAHYEILAQPAIDGDAEYIKKHGEHG
jgi:hypothetical protein